MNLNPYSKAIPSLNLNSGLESEIQPKKSEHKPGPNVKPEHEPKPALIQKHESKLEPNSNSNKNSNPNPNPN